MSCAEIDVCSPKGRSSMYLRAYKLGQVFYNALGPGRPITPSACYCLPGDDDDDDDNDEWDGDGAVDGDHRLGLTPLACHSLPAEPINPTQLFTLLSCSLLCNQSLLASQ